MDLKLDKNINSRLGLLALAERAGTMDTKPKSGRASEKILKLSCADERGSSTRLSHLLAATALLLSCLIETRLSIPSNDRNLTHPSQQFLSQPVSLVTGFHTKKSQEEEDGFIMQASSTVSQNEPAASNLSEFAPNAASSASGDTRADSSLVPTSEPPTTISGRNGEQGDQRIAIDANRQQFVTHDQLSLLDANTKDESINITNGNEQDLAASNGQDDALQRVQTSRTGMSKVSHVSSFFSDLLAYATRPRQGQLEPEYQAVRGGQAAAQPIGEGASTGAKQASQASTPAVCPGICRSILTASILCRNEIVAPCPSFLQKCCDKDDVSFNRTPVETSAPLPPPDPDPNPPPLPENVSQNHEQTPPDQQANPPIPQPQTLPHSSATAGASNQERAAPLPLKPLGGQTERPPDLWPFAPADQPGSIYFLSSSNGSSEQQQADAIRPDELGSDGSRLGEQQQQQQQQVQVSSLAQPSNDEQQSSRFKHPASQSFDSHLSERPTSQEEQANGKAPQLVVVHTANGTIIHQPGERQKQHRPTYANWTDYHLTMMQAKQNGQTVVYHSNIDPVKRFTDPASDSSRSRTQQQTTTTQAQDLSKLSTPKSNQPMSEASKEPPCADLCLPAAKQRQLCHSQSISTARCEREGEFCCARASSGLELNGTQGSNIKRTMAIPMELSKSMQNSSQLSSARQQVSDERGSERAHSKVMNDQHSNSTGLKSRASPATANSALRPEENKQSGLSEQQTTPASQTAAPQHQPPTKTTREPEFPSASNQQSVDTQALGSVGSALVELLDSWIGASSSASKGNQALEELQNPLNQMDAHATDQMPSFASPDAQNEQNQNDRRHGYDLSFRQQSNEAPQMSQNSSQRLHEGTRQSQADSGLVTGDVSSEHQVSPFAPESQASGQQSKCAGYCTLPLFTMLCDATYRSADCGPSQKCCVIGGSANSQEDDSDQPQPSSAGPIDVARQPAQACRGSCLPVYHSSLCTKPNEIQLEAPNCLPNFVCCNQPTAQDAANQIAELESLIGSNSDALGAASLANNRPTDAQQAKDSSLFAALLPPPPPPLALGNQEQQFAQEKGTLHDQMLAATGRQRPSSGQQSLAQDNPLQIYSSQAQQMRPLPPPPPPPAPASKQGNGKTSQQSGGQGIMSQLYQMFKPNGPVKQRSRPQASGGQPAQGMNYMGQVYEPYPIQPAQATGSLHPIGVVPSQLMFPIGQHGQVAALSQPHHLAGDSGLLAVDASQHKNRFALPSQQVPFDGQQHFMHQNQVIGSNQLAQKQLVGSKIHQQQAKVPYQQHQSQHLQQKGQFQATNLRPFGDSAQLLPNGELNSAALAAAFNPVGAGIKNPLGGQMSPPVDSQPSNDQVARQTTLQATNPALVPALPERQHHHHHHFNPDNALNAAVQSNQPPPRVAYRQQAPLQKQTQPSFSGLNLAFGAGDANLQLPMQQQQQQQQQQQPQYGKQMLKFEVANQSASQTVRFQPQDQRAFSSGSGSRQESSFVAQRTVGRQNAVSRPLVRGDADALRGVSAETGALGGQSVANQALRGLAPVGRPVQQPASGNKLPVADSDSRQLTFAQRAPDVNRRANNGARAPPARSGSGVKSADGDTQAQPSLSQSSSNLNVLISNGPFADLQRVESNLEASRRSPQMGSGGQQADFFAASEGQEGEQSRPAVGQLRSPVSSTTSTSTLTYDLSNTATDSAQPACPSSCLAPFVSFNCVQPDYIDENYSCPNTGSVCCMRGPPAGESVTTAKSDFLHQSTQPAALQPIASSVDNNKLDSLSLSDQAEDQPDDSSKQQASEISSASGSGYAPDASLSNVEEQSAVQAGKNRLAPTSCGLPGDRRRSSGRARGRVMGGFDARPGYWCWQAALMNNKNEYLCGGALIGAKWVLTAAHCVTQHLRSETHLYVRLGQHNLNSTQGSRFAKTVQVKTSYVHHNHNGVTLDNDIALLRLEEPVDLEEPSICLVCLPERSSQVEAGKRCTVTGYGFESEGGPAALRVRQTDLPIVTDLDCQNKTSAVLGKPFTLPASSFCAGGELGQDACHGDGGSPLSCLVDGYYELTGLVSWGYKCGSKDLPGLYSKVSAFVGWINQIVSVNN